MARLAVVGGIVLLCSLAEAQGGVHFEGKVERTERLTSLKGQACSAEDARVGYEAGLRRRAHNVSGTARIVDDCTIAIDEFFYDGQGVDVRVYGFTSQQFDGGVSLSEDLRRDTPDENETLTVTLPDGVTLDDVQVISIWCVPVATSFGDGEFVEPGSAQPMDAGCPAGAGKSVGADVGLDFMTVLAAVGALWRLHRRQRHA